MKPDPISFNPSANKKKIRSQKLKERTGKEKRERIWGKTPQKPYISSSIGDMARVMMRYACMENTYFYNTEPPPIEFYDFWQKFSVDPPNLPNDFIDQKRASIPNLKKNTSSFDFFGSYTAPVHSRHSLDEAGGTQKQKKRILTSDAQNISDIWKDVRISMSSESFISSSTKISESASAVGMETGWEDACSEDYQSSESDFGLDVQDKCRHHRHKQHYQWALGVDSQAHPADENKQSSLEFHTPQGLIDKQANAIAQSILALQKKDNRIVYDLATQPRDMDLIDHFADDIDDSFLLDSYSYSELPDEAFGPEFDFLNEEKLQKQKVRRAKKVTSRARKGRKGGGEDSEEEEEAITAKPSMSALNVTGSSANECTEVVEENCQLKRKASSRQSRKFSQGKKGAGRYEEGESGQQSEGQGAYAACMERRRRRIEEVIRAAVRSRSPMGSFRPKEGEEPLSRYKEQSSPGPAAYNPHLQGVKPNVHTALLAPRWTKDIYDTPGPGPALHVPQNRCTCEMITLHEAPRFFENETIGPGPANVDLSEYLATAKGKPKALIVSRKNKDRPDSGAPLTNIFGWTRYGLANPPRPLIIGRNEPPIKPEPGPGEYDPNVPDTRVGITIKSRIPPGENEKKPGYYNLPDLMGDGPAAPFGIREFMQMKDQSPGPVYKLYNSKPKGISLTFRPFPMKGSEDEPSPIEWGTFPATAKLKTLRRAPNAYIVGKPRIIGAKHQTPAPNEYEICEECSECIEPGASLSGRYPVKMELKPGPADYDPQPVYKKSPATVFQHIKKEKPKLGNDTLYDAPPRARIVGGLMQPRWKSKEDEKRGPGFVDIFGFTNRGKKSGIPISMKSRHTPFKYSHIPDGKEEVYNQTTC